MKQAKNCRRGSAMLWSVMVMLMIAIIVSGIIMISRLYFTRERDENYQLQAQLYAESAVEIIRDDIVGNQELSAYVSDSNTTNTYTLEFPDASNWDCTVTVSHSVVNLSSDETKKKSGQIYLTARVMRETSGGKKLEMAEVCAKMHFDDATNKWEFDGYYNL